MEGMFEFEGASSKLTSVGDLSDWDTSQVKYMGSMFSNASSLTSVGDLSSWDTSSLIAFDNMFEACNQLNVSIKLNGIQWFGFTMQNYSFYEYQPPISITIYGDGTNENEIIEMIYTKDPELQVMKYGGVKN